MHVRDLKLKDLGRGTEGDDGELTPEANHRIGFLQERLKPLLEKHPDMGELMLREYNEYSKNPDKFADSSFV